MVCLPLCLLLSVVLYTNSTQYPEGSRAHDDLAAYLCRFRPLNGRHGGLVSGVVPRQSRDAASFLFRGVSPVPHAWTRASRSDCGYFCCPCGSPRVYRHDPSSGRLDAKTQQRQTAPPHGWKGKSPQPSCWPQQQLLLLSVESGPRCAFPGHEKGRPTVQLVRKGDVRRLKAAVSKYTPTETGVRYCKQGLYSKTFKGSTAYGVTDLTEKK